MARPFLLLGVTAVLVLAAFGVPGMAGAKTVNCPKPSASQSAGGYYIGGLADVIVQAPKPMTCKAAYELLGEVTTKFGVKDGRYRANGRVWKVAVGPGQYGEGDAMILKSGRITVSAQLGG